MSTSKDTKCKSPDSASVVFGFRDRHPSFRISPVATRNVLGSAVNTMERMSTEATSSSSDICISLAADRSSWPIPNETLKARSEPREPSALAVSAMSGVVNFNTSYESVNYEILEEAVLESRSLQPRLAWQLPCAGGAQLVLRRLLISPMELHSKRYEPYRLTNRTRIRNKGHQESMVSAGCVFGCTLGNLMQHCRAEKHSLHTCILQMRRVLRAGGRAIALSTGDDVAILAQGMGVHRVMKAQARHFHELRKCKRIDSKTGHVGIVFGAATSILIAFECMSRDENDLMGLGAQLNACLQDTIGALLHWDMHETTDEDVIQSKAVECRALQRARAGVLRAQHLASKNELDEKKAMRLQLDCFRRALWVCREEVNEESQTSLLKRIESGELVDLELDSEAGGLNAPGVASLSALPPKTSVGGSTESGSSVSGSRSWSSWASFAGRESLEHMGSSVEQLSHLAARLNPG